MIITIIGAGNVATHISQALLEAGHTIGQVWSRTSAHATEVAERVGAEATTEIAEIKPNSDLYLFCVKDDALYEMIQRMPETGGIWAHTSGSLSMELFSLRSKAYGVVYPLQTFSRGRALTFADVPLFIEGSDGNVTQQLEQLATSISDSIYLLSSEKRKRLHLSAVFANNFVNHLYALSDTLLDAEGLPFTTLLPLINETAAKVNDMLPPDAQTGPAVRNDRKVMEQQLAQLTDPEMKDLYRILSESIIKMTKGN